MDDQDSDEEDEEPSSSSSEPDDDSASEFSQSAPKSSDEDDSIGSDLDDGSSINASEPEVSIANSEDLQEEEDMKNIGRSGSRRPAQGRGKSNPAFRPRPVQQLAGGYDDGILKVGVSQTET